MQYHQFRMHTIIIEFGSHVRGIEEDSRLLPISKRCYQYPNSTLIQHPFITLATLKRYIKHILTFHNNGLKFRMTCSEQQYKNISTVTNYEVELHNKSYSNGPIIIIFTRDGATSLSKHYFLQEYIFIYTFESQHNHFT